jgi:hypothetical protein
MVSRTQGTPQGGVVSPVLFNLYMHYAFDTWMARHFPDTSFVRYADDGLVHCKSEAEARRLQEAIGARLKACGLELHPEKTRIVYCRDGNRKNDYPHTSFDFLGYTFRGRLAKSKRGIYFNQLQSCPKRQGGETHPRENAGVEHRSLDGCWNRRHCRADQSDLARMVELLRGFLYERVQTYDRPPQRHSGEMGGAQVSPIQTESCQGSDLAPAVGGARTGAAVPLEAGGIAIGWMTRAV